ncbi:hypothetical protein Tco_0092603 [Tanacetum coccineum]
MPPRMTTRNAGRRTAAPRGERMGGQTGRGGGRTGEKTGRGCRRTSEQGGQGGGRGNGSNGGIDKVPDFSIVIAQQLQDVLPTIVAQVGDHISNQGINGSQNENVTDVSIHEGVRNVNMSNGGSGCSYKEFARGQEAAVGMAWEDLKALMKEEYCPTNEMHMLETDFWCHAMVRAGHAAYTD